MQPELREPGEAAALSLTEQGRAVDARWFGRGELEFPGGVATLRACRRGTPGWPRGGVFHENLTGK